MVLVERPCSASAFADADKEFRGLELLTPLIYPPLSHSSFPGDYFEGGATRGAPPSFCVYGSPLTSS
jgi:hypothetical protein